MSKDNLFKAFHRLYWLVIIILTLVICRFYLDGFYWEEPRLALSEMIAGTAHRPFVYRILVPFMIKLALSIYPMPAASYASALIWLFLLGFVICLRSFASLYWKSDLLTDFIGLISPFVLIPFMITNRHLYDFSTLFLFTLGLLLMAQKKWGWFLLVYALGCLNKETTVLLSLVFLGYYRHKIRDWAFWRLMLAQGVIYVGARAAIMWRFQHNPGAVIENHLRDYWFVIQAAPFLILAYIVFIVLMLVMVIKDWKRKPVFLRTAMLTLGPTLAILYLIGGYPFEIRVFYELYPVLLLLAAPALGKIFRLDFWAAQTDDTANFQPELAD